MATKQSCINFNWHLCLYLSHLLTGLRKTRCERANKETNYHSLVLTPFLSAYACGRGKEGLVYILYTHIYNIYIYICVCVCFTLARILDWNVKEGVRS